MSLFSSDAPVEARLPAPGPFAPVNEEGKTASEMTRAMLTSVLALYPVLAAVAVAVISLTLSA